MIVQRTCTVCDAAEQITISKVVAERVLNADHPKTDPITKDTKAADP